MKTPINPPTNLDEINAQIAEEFAALRNDRHNDQLRNNLDSLVAAGNLIAKNVIAQIKVHDMLGEVPVIGFLPKSSGIKTGTHPEQLKELTNQEI